MRRHEASRILVDACQDLLEAISLKQRHRARAALEKQLDRKIAAAFKAQGKALAKRMERISGLFQEALRDDEWLSHWNWVAKTTRQLFVGPIDTYAKAAILAGARQVLKEAGADIAFDLKNPRAQAWLKDRAATQVSLVEETTKKRIRTLLVDGQAAGKSWSQIAKEIQGEFKEFAVGKPQAHVDSRAHLVAMTEVGEAYTEGNLQAAQELQLAGIDQEKFWSTVGDNRVSDGCHDNQAAGWIALADEFPSGHLRPLRFPGCRCDLLTRRAKGDKSAGGAGGGSGGGKPPPGGADGGDKMATTRQVNRFLKSGRPKEINVARLPEDWLPSIGAESSALKLSKQTLRKQRLHRPGFDESLYHDVQDLIDGAQLVVKDRDRSLVLFKRGDELLYAALKATNDGKKVYLTSLRAGGAKDPKRMRKRAAAHGAVIKDTLQ